MRRGFNRSGFDTSFAQLIAGVTASRIAIHRAAVQVEIDVDASTPVPGDNAAVAELVRLMVDQALDGMAGRGDLTVTLWQNDGCLELEFADSGTAIEHRARRLPILAASLGAKLRWQNCPQGGAAVTICFDKAARRRAAA